MSDLVECCPECRYYDISVRSSAPLDERWICRDCGHTFAEPARRERREQQGLRPGTRRGAAGELADADPSDLALSPLGERERRVPDEEVPADE